MLEHRRQRGSGFELGDTTSTQLMKEDAAQASS